GIDEARDARLDRHSRYGFETTGEFLEIAQRPRDDLGDADAGRRRCGGRGTRLRMGTAGENGCGDRGQGSPGQCNSGFFEVRRQHGNIPSKCLWVCLNGKYGLLRGNLTWNLYPAKLSQCTLPVSHKVMLLTGN